MNSEESNTSSSSSTQSQPVDIEPVLKHRLISEDFNRQNLLTDIQTNNKKINNRKDENDEQKTKTDTNKNNAAQDYEKAEEVEEEEEEEVEENDDENEEEINLVLDLDNETIEVKRSNEDQHEDYEKNSKSELKKTENVENDFVIFDFNSNQPVVYKHNVNNESPSGDEPKLIFVSDQNGDSSFQVHLLKPEGASRPAIKSEILISNVATSSQTSDLNENNEFKTSPNDQSNNKFN